MYAPYYALLAHRQFVVWRFETRRDKQTKIPLDPTGAYPASVTDPANYLDYNTAAAIAATKGYGVGFVLTDNDPFFLLDMDKCRDDAGQWSPLSQALAKQCHGALIETSVSAKGLHVIGSYTVLPDHAKKNTALGLELYHTDRFIALGDMAGAIGTADHPCDNVLLSIIAEYFPPRSLSPDHCDDWTDGPVEGWVGMVDDQALIEQAHRERNTGAAFGAVKATFSALWSADLDVLAEAYPSDNADGFDRSSADLALASKLAFYTGHDCERIVRIMHLSGLERDKWQREDYMRATVLRATADRSQFYSSRPAAPTTTPDSDDSIEAVRQLIEGSAGDVSAMRGILQAIGALNDPLTRAAVAQTYKRSLKDEGLLNAALGRQIDEELRTVAAPAGPRGQYGKNHTENAAMFLANQYPDNTLIRSDQVWYSYVGRGWRTIEDDDLKHLLVLAMAPCFPQHADVTGTYSMIVGLSHCTGRKLSDRPDNLILFDNGVLDLTTGALLPHSPDYFTTNVLPYNYTPLARCDRWLQFLDEVFEGDAERIALLQEWFGYMLSSSYAYHKVLLMLGPARSGKGTIGRVLEQIVGAQNYTGGSLHAFTSDSFIDSLRVKPVMFIGDSEQRVSRNHIDQVIERIKKISGNDAITFDRKYKSTLSETLPTRITIAANSTPRLFDDSGALANRMLMLTFDVSFLGREDPHLIDALLAEVEGIAAWSLQGMARLNMAGRFTAPTASEAEASMMREAYSPLEQFVEEVCQLGTKDVTSTADVYEAYRTWAVLNQEEYVLARKSMVKAFGDIVRGKGCKYGPHRQGDKVFKGFKGLTLVPLAAGMAGAFTPKVV